jgi:hypothetical protein
MTYFAVLDENNIVLNLIVADSLEDAEQVTEKTCVEYSIPEINDTFLNGKFIKPQPL